MCAIADEKVSTELKKQIVQARTAKKLTQAQLGQVRMSSLVTWSHGQQFQHLRMQILCMRTSLGRGLYGIASGCCWGSVC
jgi:hypothetical protein